MEMCSLIQAQIMRQYGDEFEGDFNVLAKKTYIGSQQGKVEIPKSHILDILDKTPRCSKRLSARYKDTIGSTTLWLTPPLVRKGKLIKVGKSGQLRAAGGAARV